MTYFFIHSIKVSVKEHIGINSMPDTVIDNGVSHYLKSHELLPEEIDNIEIGKWCR